MSKDCSEIGNEIYQNNLYQDFLNVSNFKHFYSYLLVLKWRLFESM